MEEGRKHIDDLFREGLEGYREVPDAAVWNSIEQRLPKRGGRRSFLWLWVLLMLALLSSLGYYANKHYFTDDVQPAGQEAYSQSSSGTSRDQSPEDPGADPASEVSGRVKQGNDPEEDKEDATDIRPEEKQSSGSSVAGSDKNRTGSDQTGSEKNKKPIPGVVSGTAAPKSSGAATGNKPAGNGTHQAEMTGTTTKTGRALGSATDNGKANNTTGRKLTPKNGDVRSAPDKKDSNYFASGSQASPPKEEKSKSSTKQSTAAGQAPAPQGQVSKPGATASSQQSPAAQKPVLQPEKKASSSKQVAAAASDPSLPPEEKAKSSKPSSIAPPNTALPAKAATSAPSSPEKSSGKASPPIAGEKSTGNKPADPGTSKAKPLNTQPEKGANDPLPVSREAAQGMPVPVQAAPSEKKSKMEVTYEDAKGNPISIEPAKEYGIKMDEMNLGSEDKNEVTSGGGAATGAGAGGTGEPKKKNGIKIDGGIKLGYDRGFADFTTSNFTGNVFLQWNISRRTSLVLQPGLRYHSLNKTSLFPQSAYHQITSATLDSAHVYVDSAGSPQVQRNYIYRNGYDSISVSYGMNPQKYIEIELPLLLQYKLAENLSVFGGMQLAFGKVITIQGNTQRFGGTRIDTFSLPQVDTSLWQTSPGLDGYFGYATPEIGQLDENKYRNPITNPARFGLMLGFSYEFKKRLLIDLLMRKNLSNLNYIPNEEVRKIYSQPYFRITIGYKLFQSK